MIMKSFLVRIASSSPTKLLQRIQVVTGVHMGHYFYDEAP